MSFGYCEHHECEVYELNRESDYVQKMLKWKTKYGHVIRVGMRTNLHRLNEEKFVSLGFHTIKFAFLNILQDYMTIGKGTKELRRIHNGATQPIEHFLEAHTADMTNISQFYGEVLAKRIQQREPNPKKVRDVRNRLLNEIKTEQKRI